MSTEVYTRIPRMVREWKHQGLYCMVLRMPDMHAYGGLTIEGHHCGYVRLPGWCGLPDAYDDAPEEIQDAAHCGLTFSGTPWHADGGLWYGFDMAHACDYESRGPLLEHYLRSDDDAIAATERLADAIAQHVGRES